jgi:hypothetical protein
MITITTALNVQASKTVQPEFSHFNLFQPKPKDVTHRKNVTSPLPNSRMVPARTPIR